LRLLGRLDEHPLGVLRLGSYRLFAISRVCSGIASSMLQAIVLWQVYALSGSALDLGLIGLARFAPALAFSLIGGVVVDTYNRRTILLLAQAVPAAATVVMLAALLANTVSMTLLYGMMFAIGTASSFEGPARQALIPMLVPRAMFSRAITLNSTLQSLAFVTGPAVGGALIAWQGVSAAYAAHGALLLLAMAALFRLRLNPVSGGSRAGLHLGAVREGLAFLRSKPVLLGAMTLDMFAVIFGGAKALLPIYAVDVLHADATGYGILTASLEAGALVAALVMVSVPTPKETGRTLLVSVAAFGLATMAFGLSTWLPVSVLAYAAVGAADQVSVVMRQNTIQLATPDELRGRVTAVNFVFVNASNQIGGVESGIVAALTSAVFAVVSGGAACLAVVGLVSWRIPELRRHQAHRMAAAVAHH
jgi:MFS family permease